MHWDEAEGERGLDGAIRFVERWDGSFEGRVRGLLAPARIETQTPELLVRTRESAARLGVPVRLHAAQSHEEVALLSERYDARPVEVLDRLGLLGPGLMVPHCWAVDGHSSTGGSGAAAGEDVRRLAETGTTVVFCPIVCGRYGIVLESFDSYRRAGVRMGIGTDTFPPDVLHALDLGSALTKAVEHDHTAGSVADLFRAATLGGAAALGRPDLGRLAVGAKADLVVVGLDDLRLGPIEDPIRSIVAHGGGRDVRHVVVDGRFVVRDGAVPGLDARAMRARAQRFFDDYRASFTERDALRRPVGTLMPPSFPVRG
jgi:cytosine/adenosine deaminase-related metal-dependent hydrolase